MSSSGSTPSGTRRRPQMIQIAELDRALREEGDAALSSASEVEPLLRRARAAKRACSQPEMWRRSGDEDEVMFELSGALSAFDFAD